VDSLIESAMLDAVSFGCLNAHLLDGDPFFVVVR
jgi:hypothetical protein